MNRVEEAIEKAFEIATENNLKNSSKAGLNTFRMQLYRIATSAYDECRNEISNSLQTKSSDLLNKSLECGKE